MAVCVKVKSTRSLGSSRDFSIYDFAHSAQSKGRATKSNKLAIDASEIEEPLDDDELRSRHSSSSNKMQTVTTEEDVSYCDYVIDIWFLISEHIRPEDVGRFALICRKTAEVVQSAQFWHHLYRKHYNWKVDLPRRLQPDCMSLLRGLRARTIRSLFYTYQPFVYRITATPFTDPHRVAGRQLIFSWSSKTKGGWNYFFKLKARMIPGSRAARSARLQDTKESLEYLQDTYMNPEEGCQILIITTDTLHLLPQYHEQLYVKSLTQTLAQGLTKYKVRLLMANYCQRIVDEMVFVPVRQVRLLDWWNPEYYRVDPTIQEKQSVEEQEDSAELADNETDNAFWDD